MLLVPLDKRVRVEETLAVALEMYGEWTTPAGLARYVAEQVGPKHVPRDVWDLGPAGVEYLFNLAVALTPPDDRRMSFRERPGRAAHEARPRTYGEALNTFIDLGWGNTLLDIPASTPRSVGETLKEALDERGRALALALLGIWKLRGAVYEL